MTVTAHTAGNNSRPPSPATPFAPRFPWTGLRANLAG